MVHSSVGGQLRDRGSLTNYINKDLLRLAHSGNAVACQNSGDSWHCYL